MYRQVLQANRERTGDAGEGYVSAANIPRDILEVRLLGACAGLTSLAVNPRLFPRVDDGHMVYGSIPLKRRRGLLTREALPLFLRAHHIPFRAVERHSTQRPEMAGAVGPGCGCRPGYPGRRPWQLASLLLQGCASRRGAFPTRAGGWYHPSASLGYTPALHHPGTRHSQAPGVGLSHPLDTSPRARLSLLTSTKWLPDHWPLPPGLHPLLLRHTLLLLRWSFFLFHPGDSTGHDFFSDLLRWHLELLFRC